MKLYLTAMTFFCVFIQFFLLGLTSFGGPAAHLGYFRNHFVEKKQWLSDDEYAQLIALSQFLPGPGSSQVGFALGLKKAGLLGGIAAFIGFTLPSFIIMYALFMVPQSENLVLNSVISAAKLFAVAVVFDAVLAMSKQFCQVRLHQVLAIVALVCCLLLPSLWSQLAVILIAALSGVVFLKKEQIDSKQKNALIPPRFKLLTAFIALFAACFVIPHPMAENFRHFASAGSIVFGGGHVVLPLLQQLLPNIPTEQFLFGYAGAQGIPGPMFALASFLGAAQYPQWGIVASLVATLAIFLPGLILMYSLLPSWQSLQQINWCVAAVNGINAAVVGILAAALYTPVFSSAVHNSQDMALVCIGVLLLRVLKLPVLAVICTFIPLVLLFNL